MTKNRIVGECNNCKKEDSINCISGLCPSCEDKCNKLKEKEFEKLKEENENIRNRIDNVIGINNPQYSPLWELINELVENELKHEEFCNH